MVKKLQDENQDFHIVVIQREPAEIKRIRERYLRDKKGAPAGAQFYTQYPSEALRYVEKLKDKPPLLIVTSNYFMAPEMIGPELLTQVAKIHPESIRVLYSLTANTSPLFGWLSKSSLDSAEHVISLMCCMHPEATMGFLKQHVPYLSLPLAPKSTEQSSSV